MQMLQGSDDQVAPLPGNGAVVETLLRKIKNVDARRGGGGGGGEGNDGGATKPSGE